MQRIIIPQLYDIYSVEDNPKNPIVKLPTDNLHSERKKRTHHKKRYVLIVQNCPVKLNQYKTILIAPLSSQGRDTN